MASAPAPRDPAVIEAAGVVVFRPGKRVLLVHRPKYDDWSFPKGKLERGEHACVAAVREVAEETGLHVRLGPPLSAQRYAVKGRPKRVSYWTGRAVGSPDVSGYEANDEVDRLGWFELDAARDRLSYPHDLATLEEAVGLRRKTHTLVVLRHATARSRKSWRADDRTRPLLQSGRVQAFRLVPQLAAYDVRRLVSSSSTRCVETLEPFAGTTGWKLETDDVLSEEGASQRGVERLVRSVVDDLLERKADAGGTVVCTHRPVLPWVTEAAGVAPDVTEPGLEPGEMLVLHLRRGRVVAAERHTSR
ncbi:NUDIX hydrolase [Nocardioides sp. SYSU D00038]|uniref:NUDIX hydrolase n=1 Tax=Nocardioides sp. SYSU D00038 TaxID=2812554 RepID=UPI0019685D25|nr:NUDIX hydrolase [Nocardioides sp. SYSU D00038]